MTRFFFVALQVRSRQQPIQERLLAVFFFFLLLLLLVPNDEGKDRAPRKGRGAAGGQGVGGR
jgi:hypothetical protein